ncbi:hypothetical protein E2553_00210 [Paraburkholderia dipogonis]|uniref:Uncharacterized protein n=1 Tax=Paraburkholderia dipogonis TaxID=1211383 RepID=A0A4Y8N1Y7_9BURK|nr:hypothetical protein [Paraburkholderia dipogonis]TFE43593.1 hypothetical protein E2553_00210 [Paraburkholderia dipogonis]
MEFTHIANPVKVHAQQITRVLKSFAAHDARVHDGCIFELSDGTDIRLFLDDARIARYEPIEGDYVVTQEDGYVYFNPKDVFERKYSTIENVPAEAPAPADKAPEGGSNEKAP